MTNQNFKSIVNLNEDEIIIETREKLTELRNKYLDPVQLNEEYKKNVIENNSNWNKSLVDNKIKIANWEEIIDTLGFNIIRNKLFQEINEYTTYYANKISQPMQPCLVKVFNLRDHLKNHFIQKYDRTICLIHNIKNDRIQQLLGAVEVRQTGKMYLFVELAKTTLTKYLKDKNEHLSIIDSKIWISEIISGLIYLHNLGLAHTKLSPDAILLFTDTGKLKINCPEALAEQVVFDPLSGLSKFNEIPKPTSKRFYHSFDCLHSSSKTYDAMSSDVWAVGVTLYFLLTLKRPFPSFKNKKEMMIEVNTKRWSFIGITDNYPRLDEETKAFLGLIFTNSAESRSKVSDLVLDSYLFKKEGLAVETPPPLPPPPPPPQPPPAVRTELEEEYDTIMNEKKASINPKEFFENIYTKIRFYYFAKLEKTINSIKINQFYEKSVFEENIHDKGYVIIRKNLIHECNDLKAYEAKVQNVPSIVHVAITNNFLTNYRIKDIETQCKLMINLNNCDKFVPFTKAYTIQNKLYFFFKTDLNWIKLSDKLEEENPAPLATVKSWLKQLTQAIYFLHKKCLAFLYLDSEYIYIKPDNQIIISNNETIWSAFTIENEPKPKLNFPQKLLVKSPYSSPESLYTNTTFDPFQADVWSIATIIYHALFLRIPFEFHNKKIFYEQIEQRRWLHIIDKKYKLENDFFEFFNSIFIENPENRINLIEILFMKVTNLEN